MWPNEEAPNMKIAILGGTGKLGLVLARRFHRSGHQTKIGSREIARAVEAASIDPAVGGASNAEAATWCDAALVSVPYRGHGLLVEPLKENLSGKIIIDATVPLDPANLLQTKTESGKSAAEETAALIPDAAVFAAFQTVSHRVLGHDDVSLDVLVAGGQRKADVMNLIRSMKLNPIDAGPIEAARQLEQMTVLMLSINKANKVKECGIKITGI
jgi:8-hydroxy-5-deazaflavin:NADPH oxidoreductase